MKKMREKLVELTPEQTKEVLLNGKTEIIFDGKIIIIKPEDLRFDKKEIDSLLKGKH